MKVQNRGVDPTTKRAPGADRDSSTFLGLDSFGNRNHQTIKRDTDTNPRAAIPTPFDSLAAAERLAVASAPLAVWRSGRAEDPHMAAV